jgi:lipoprotein-anchoring transpeptidase ErfK/SrfK
MKPTKMKPPFRLSWRDLISRANYPLLVIKVPLQWSVQHATAISHFPLKKMRKPFYVSLFGVVTITGTSFKNALPLTASSVTASSYFVVITKSKYELKVFDSTGDWIVTYPVVFGNKDQGDKMMEGDRKTPEGTFHILAKRKHEKWNSFIALDYPTQESYQKFNQRKAAGMIPAGARIGGSIGIHGVWPHEDYAVDQYQNWTEGCISTKNMYIEEIFKLLPVGTTIQIRK